MYRGVYVYVGACAYVCVCMWRIEIILKCFSSISYLVILRHCLSLACGWPIRLGWMASEHQASACFCLLKTECASTRPYTHLSLWVLEIQLRSPAHTESAHGQKVSDSVLAFCLAIVAAIALKTIWNKIARAALFCWSQGVDRK